MEFVAPNKFLFNVLRSNILFLKMILVSVKKECNFRCKSCASQYECTNCLIQQNRNCICNSGYFESENNVCISRNSIEGKSKEVCKYKDCTDQQWTYGEDCDDVNTIEEMDVLIVKQIPIINVSIIYLSIQLVLNVVIIVIKAILILKQVPQFVLNVSKDTLLNNQFVLNVLNNVYNVQIVHLTALHTDLNQITKVGIYSNFESNTCYSKCGDGIMSLDEKCDDGNKLNGDGCDVTGRLETQFICKDSVCISLNILITISNLIYQYRVQYQQGYQSIYNNVRLFQLSYNILIRMLKQSF